jgi:hypothetical protein
VFPELILGSMCWQSRQSIDKALPSELDANLQATANSGDVMLVLCASGVSEQQSGMCFQAAERR